MRTEISPPSLLLLTFTVSSFFFFLTVLPVTHSHRQPPPYGDCQSSFECGNLKGISYPFWGNGQSHCGRQGFELQCQPNLYPVINMENQSFTVLKIEQNSQWMKLARSDIWNGACPLLTTELDHSPFSFQGSGTRNISMFRGCPREISDAGDAYNVSCETKNGSVDLIYVEWEAITDTGTQCDIQITVPVLISAYDQVLDGSLTPKEALDEGFVADFHYEEEELCKACRNSSGICIPDDTNLTRIRCLCQGKPDFQPCLEHERDYKKLQGSRYLGYGFASGVLFACLVLVGYKTTVLVSRMIKAKTTKDTNIETYIKKYGTLAPKRYRCSDIKKITDSFAEKLGEGGFCSVYKGKLEDGSLVAVKVLKTGVSIGNGEEFLNEVISICKTSHVNIVSLIGYCYTKDKQALLFEFMPNGSLEKFIHNENISTAGRLAWDKLHEIAIGIARDENFCPKISDFGLSKLCPKESVISMSGARGTVGYIAPELFNRNFGRVSHKADVYSFGMMVLEMVGGRKNIDESADYPHCFYDRLQNENCLGLHGVTTSHDNEIAKKMIIIGLWCIQTYPVHRPSMNEILFMLEGNLDALKIPPKPFIHTPSRTPLDLYTTPIA
ncbi:hypothetical protein V6N13_125715 [Hibiscus sabdariffa]